MASGKTPRIDRFSSSSGCSRVTLVLFAGFSLVGVWMLTSRTIIPSEFSRQGTMESVLQTEVFHSGSSTSNFADHSGNAFTNTSMPADHRWIDRKANKNRKNNLNASEVNVGDQGVDNIIEHNVEGNTNRIEENTIVYKPAGGINNQETNSSLNIKGNSYGGHKESDKESSNQQENNEIEKNKLHKEDVTKDVTVGSRSELLNETTTQVGAWSTQVIESRNEKELLVSSSKGEVVKHNWKLCNVTAEADYIPCLDNEVAIELLPDTKHFEHRERYCPAKAPTCLVSLPNGYRMPIKWPNSRDKIWYHNVPHTKLVEYKGSQNWVRFSGEYLTFPGGGTQFKFGASHYIDFIQKSFPKITWGKHSRVILDVGCGVASFGGYQFDRDVLTLSFAPKDEHEAQVQLALERGIPALVAVMGTKRLPFPGMVFDAIHCARCRVSWHIDGGRLLLELNRLLRPGGVFIWSATPVYQNKEEDIWVWKAMAELTKKMCWEMVSKTKMSKMKDPLYKIGLVIFRKPSNNECYERRVTKTPPFCPETDDPNSAWNVSLQACVHKLPVDSALRGSRWPAKWPTRLEKVPYWLDKAQVGVYGKPAPEDFQADFAYWKRVSKSYKNGIGVNWPSIRNVMDMRSVYGGFAAALSDLELWVMNVVSIDSPDTLPIIYERGLFGMYHDWCESFSTYPRTYDLLHADHLFSMLKTRCDLLPVISEVDRILRPQGILIVRDDINTISEIEEILRSLHWELKQTFSKNNEGFLCMQKTMWRPQELETSNASVS